MKPSLIERISLNTGNVCQMTKPSYIIYCNNILAYILFSILKLIFPKNTAAGTSSALFINSGQLGDIIISTLIFDNEEKLLKKHHSITFVIKEEYKQLFASYKGGINILFYNYKHYKWNLIYKIKLLRSLRSTKFKYCFNLTAARGILNDELSLLAGAEETYALNSDWKYLKKIFGKRMDSYYNGIIGRDNVNEYEKHFAVLKYLLPNPFLQFTQKGNIILFELDQKNKTNVEGDHGNNRRIIIAPFSSLMNRDWPINKLKHLFEKLKETNYKVTLIGSKSQKKKLVMFGKTNEQIKVLAGELPLNKLPILLNSSILFVGLDSGLTHLALRLGIPTVAIIGGGMHGKFLPSPCSKGRANYLFATCDYFMCEWNCRYKEKKCITDVDVCDVYNTIEAILNC